MCRAGRKTVLTHSLHYTATIQKIKLTQLAGQKRTHCGEQTLECRVTSDTVQHAEQQCAVSVHSLNNKTFCPAVAEEEPIIQCWLT